MNALVTNHKPIPSMVPPPLTCALNDVAAADVPSVGGKAANLGAMMGKGLPVPPGFCVTTQAFKALVDGDETAEDLLTRLNHTHAGQQEELRHLATRVRDHLLGLSMPLHVREAIVSSWKSQGVEAAYAVRSSATAEDGVDASFAGQQDTFLNVRGEQPLLEAVQRCWASLFTDRAVHYRATRHMDHRHVAMAVVVQRMVDAEISGVLFGADPVTGRADRIVIEGTWGLGEALVGGKVSPDRWVIDKANLQVLERSVQEKSVVVRAMPEGGVQEDAAEAGKANTGCLDEALTQQLCGLACKAEAAFGAPQDMEWAFRDGTVLLLQSRPITTKLARKTELTADERQVWTNANVGELMPDVVLPLSWSFLEKFILVLLNAFFGRLGIDLNRLLFIGRVGGRVYANLNTFTAFIRSLPGLGKMDVADMFGGQQGKVGQVDAVHIRDEDLPRIGVTWLGMLIRLPGLLVWLAGGTVRKGNRLLHAMRTEIGGLLARDRTRMTEDELVAMLEPRNLAVTQRGDDIAVAAGGIAAFNQLKSVCKRWLGDEDGALVNRLMMGLGSMDSAEAGISMWRLAVLCREHPEVERVILAGPLDRLVMAGLPGGPTFLAAWDDFMARHGHHARGELDIAVPRWAETPELVADMVRGFLRSMDRTNPLAARDRNARDRDRLTQECRDRLGNPFKRVIFNVLLSRARGGLSLRENVKSEFIRLAALARWVYAELGKRLQQRGLLVDAMDIFYLYAHEIDPVRQGVTPCDVRTTVAARKAEVERWRQVTPPAVVVGRYDPDEHVPAKTLSAVETWNGLAVSAGVATGRARVILSADCTEHVLPGEILVAPFTDPGWSPYFLTAAGIVMDMGGMLSHGSIVAREYGIPAVVNVGPATKVIKTGQRLRVDGNRGVVHVLPDDGTCT